MTEPKPGVRGGWEKPFTVCQELYAIQAGGLKMKARQEAVAWSVEKGRKQRTFIGVILIEFCFERL